VRIALSPEAIADLERLRDFLVEKDARAASRASETLAEAIDSLLLFPERGRMSPLPHHCELVVPFGKSAYVVRYKFRAESQTVSIVRVWHGREERG
jgi:plasmid stabilization system protein ParE